MHLEPTQYVLAAISALLVGFSKTGLPGVSIPAIILMAEAFPDNAQLSVGAIMPFLVASDIFAVVRYHHHAQWKQLWRLFPAVIAGAIPGVYALNHLSANSLRPWIGWLVLGLLAFELWRQWRELAFRRRCFAEAPTENAESVGFLPKGLLFTSFTGFLAGFSTILANAAMPVMSVYLVSQGFNKREFVGTAAWFFFILNASKIPINFAQGLMPASLWSFWLTLIPVTFFGAWLGTYLLRMIPQKLFNALALVLAGAAALRLILH